jgi:hypothetical protein
MRTEVSICWQSLPTQTEKTGENGGSEEQRGRNSELGVLGNRRLEGRVGRVVPESSK